jgi:hypothetical protein
VQLIAIIEAVLHEQSAGGSELPAINTKLASIHTPLGLDGIFTSH